MYLCIIRVCFNWVTEFPNLAQILVIQWFVAQRGTTVDVCMCVCRISGTHSYIIQSKSTVLVKAFCYVSSILSLSTINMCFVVGVLVASI